MSGPCRPARSAPRPGSSPRDDHHARIPPPAGYPTVPAHPAPPLRPELPDGVEPTPTGPRWKAWTAWVALITGFVAAGVLGAIVIGVGAAAGSPFDDPTARR